MKVIGHRGAGGLAPENTAKALLKGIEYGVDELEFDVRVSKDGIVIGHHAPTITDSSGASLEISTHAFTELQQHKSDLITLGMAISTIGGRVPLCIDIKPSQPTTPIISVIAMHLAKSNPPTLRVASFDMSILRDVHEALPDIQIVINERWSGIRGTYRARQLHTRRITMNQRWLWSGFIHSMYKRGYELSAYTMNDPRKARIWQQKGLYGVVTDYPDRFTRRQS